MNRTPPLARFGAFDPESPFCTATGSFFIGQLRSDLIRVWVGHPGQVCTVFPYFQSLFLHTAPTFRPFLGGNSSVLVYNFFHLRGAWQGGLQVGLGVLYDPKQTHQLGRIGPWRRSDWPLACSGHSGTLAMNFGRGRKSWRAVPAWCQHGTSMLDCMCMVSKIDLSS